MESNFNGRCDHEQMKSAEGCTVEIIGEYNPDHFLVGTQDTDMRKKFQEVSFFFFFISFKFFYSILMVNELCIPLIVVGLDSC